MLCTTFLSLLDEILYKKFVQRNWELQFLTADDQGKLTDYLQSKELIHQIDIDLNKALFATSQPSKKI